MRPVSRSTSLMLILAYLLLCSDKGWAKDPDGTQDAVRRSTFIFIGTVVKLNAATMPDVVKASKSTAVVRVDKVLDGPGAPPDLVASKITVQLSRAWAIRVGQSAVFFTKGWLMGESIAVIEVAPPGDARDWQQVYEMVQKIRHETADEALQRELASAEVVVVGTVKSVGPGGLPELPTEHTPLWQKAAIQVQQPALKGSVSGYTVTVFFPSSADPAWLCSPKFKMGQNGIWLLHRKQMGLPGLENQFTALKPVDFQTRIQLARIQQFLKSAR